MLYLESTIIILLIIAIVVTFLKFNNDRKLFREVIDIVIQTDIERSLLDDREELLEITQALVISQLEFRRIEIEYLSYEHVIEPIINASCRHAENIINECDKSISRVKNIHDLYKTPGEDKKARGGS